MSKDNWATIIGEGVAGRPNAKLANDTPSFSSAFSDVYLSGLQTATKLLKENDTHCNSQEFDKLLEKAFLSKITYEDSTYPLDGLGLLQKAAFIITDNQQKPSSQNTEELSDIKKAMLDKLLYHSKNLVIEDSIAYKHSASAIVEGLLSSMLEKAKELYPHTQEKVNSRS